MVIIRECSFFWGKYTPKYLGINKHHVCNLLSNVQKKLYAHMPMYFILYTHTGSKVRRSKGKGRGGEVREEEGREGKGRRGEKKRKIKKCG